MARPFDQNPYFLRIDSVSSEVFSVLGFTSQTLSFNHDYRFTVTFRLRESIDLKSYIGCSAHVGWEEGNIHGVVSCVGKGYIELASPLYVLNLKKHSRVYADKNVESLISAVLTPYGWKPKVEFKFLLEKNYPELKYSAQYQETDLEFIQRHCSRWGILFGFVQQTDRAVLFFSDNSQLFSQQFSVLTIPFEKFSQYKLARKILATSVLINDYNPETPDLSLQMTAESPEQGWGCDERPYEFYQTEEYGKLMLKRRLEYYDSLRETILATIDNLTIQLGQRIQTKHDLTVSEICYDINILNNQKHIVIKLINGEKLLRPELPTLFHMPDVTAHIISEKVDSAGRYFISPDYDETKTHNTYPVRLLQPCTGNNTGFHFPLIKNTRVLITHINGDPDRPVIVGVMPDHRIPVTETNKTQQVLMTPNGNQWLMDDDETHAGLRFNTSNNQVSINILSDEISFLAEQNSVLQAAHFIHEAESLYQQVGKYHAIYVEKNYQVAAQEIVLSSGKDLGFQARDIYFNSPAQSGNIEIKSGKTIIIESEKINLSGAQKIIMMVGQSSVVLSSEGLIVNANSVNFRGAVSAPLAQLGSVGTGQSQHIAENKFGLAYLYADGNFVPYILSQGEQILGSGIIRQNNSFQGIDVSQKLSVSHSGLAVVGIDRQPLKPTEKFEFQPQSHKSLHITALKKTLYKTVHEQRKKFNCELLSPPELDYLKNHNDNTVVVFIHGYNVPAGQFGKYPYIRTPQEGFLDDSINGWGAPNWLLHMEYNLNCAAHNCYPEFDWEKHALDYRRIVGIHWPGYKKIFDIPYSSGLNFAGMEFNAIQSSYALVPLINQLKNAGLKIYLLAHSLGCLVAIQLLDLFGREHACAFEHVVLWEAAVSKNALSPAVLNTMEQSRTAVKQTIVGEGGSLALPPMMLYEYYGEFLRQKAAKFKDVPLWEVYEKDPFAYFPYAHIASKKFHVLYSHEDEVLKWAYRIDLIKDLPHSNLMYNPMGLYGPDEDTQKLLGHKLISTDQQDWLLGHSAMRIPNPSLFEHIYRLIIKELWT